MSELVLATDKEWAEMFKDFELSNLCQKTGKEFHIAGILRNPSISAREQEPYSSLSRGINPENPDDYVLVNRLKTSDGDPVSLRNVLLRRVPPSFLRVDFIYLDNNANLGKAVRYLHELNDMGYVPGKSLGVISNGTREGIIMRVDMNSYKTHLLHLEDGWLSPEAIDKIKSKYTVISAD